MDSSPGKPASMASLPPTSTATPSSAPSSSTTAGVKRPAPSLLPAFEPLSSSPFLPRPTKRQARAGSIGSNAYTKYPTPVPTSSTGILSSSPPRVGGRPALQRTQSSVSERAPLCAVPSIELNDNGETLTMGRSSNASHFQLSANRLISRVHVKARYIAAADIMESNKIEIICNGWNGLKLHCQGRTWDMGKGDTFTSETENVEIMIDVQDARVRLQWPSKKDDSLATLSDSSWDDSPRSRTANCNAPGASVLQSSPLRRAARIMSPESPTPAHASTSSASLQALISDDESAGPQIQIYEDASADEQELPKHSEQQVGGDSFATEITNSFSSELSDPQSDSDHENDPNEENDPIVHSFGPFGANLSNRMASFTPMSPNIRPPLSRISSGSDTTALAASNALGIAIQEEPSEESSAAEAPSKSATPSPAKPKISAGVNVPNVTNHLVNQLAFSRLSSSPLSTIMGNLPAEEKKGLTQDDLRLIIEDTACVGVIPRQGKDAAGKPLESEYYYVPDMDDDASRRAAVVDGLRKPSLRNCRKQHKQYYWKRPRTP